MSHAVRQLIADAASSVEGVTVSPYFRQTTKTGQGMVRLDRMLRSTNGFGYMNTWQVVIMLPTDLAAAEKWMDEKMNDLVEHISEAIIVTSVMPQQLALETGTLPVVIIEGNREQE